MTDLKSKKWIVAKGVMFFSIAALTGPDPSRNAIAQGGCLSGIAGVGLLPLLYRMVGST